MLDVLHYYFEQDSRFTSPEEVESVNALRTQLYVLYGKTYKYGSSTSGSGERKYISGDDSDFSLPDEFSPKERKPYIPPTDFNPNSAMPFGSVLDAPLG